MNIAAYVRLPNMIPPCVGVSRHTGCMLRGLSERHQVHVIASARDLTASGSIASQNTLAGYPVVPLPFSQWTHERAWHAIGMPAIERWASGFDWVYSPTETYIATRTTPLAVTVHDLMPLETDLPWSASAGSRAMRRRWSLKFRPIVKHASLLLAVSNFTKQRLIQLLGISPERIAVVGNGVDDMFFRPSPAGSEQLRGLVGDDPYVLVTGGLTAKKGGGSVLAIAEAMHRRASPMRFVVVGFYNDPGLLERSRSLPNVVHAGHVTDEAYHSLLGHARSLLFLSRYEGFGIPLIEAMAMGVPVVASTFASIPEVVGDAGFLVDASKADEIADLLQGLLDRPAMADAMIARGLARATQCRWSQCVERLERAMAKRS